MHKKLLVGILCSFLMASSLPAFAKCDGGETVTGVLNGHAYCKSQSMMTWWAAFAWCKYQNRELVTLSEACIDWRGATGANACPNLMVDKDQYVWTANPQGSNSAFLIEFTSGYVGLKHLRSYDGIYALCY